MGIYGTLKSILLVCRKIAKVPKVANAKLIAAAPELLEVLDDLLEYIDNYTPYEVKELLIDNAHAAVAKATQ